MRVIFMGTPEFACKPLACLVESEHDVLAVVTGPDEPKPRGRGLQPTPVHQEAKRYGLPVFTPSTLKNKQLREELKALQPDIFVVVAFKILPRKLFTLPKYGSMNIHASLLPRYRGAAPINWALINGDKETGLTSFLLQEKVDTGDIVLQEKVPIYDDDTFDTLYARLSELAGPFLLRSLDTMMSDGFTPIPQDDSQASPAPKIFPTDAMIDFGFPAENVRNFIRGLSSVPGAYTFFRGARVKILRCQVIPDNEYLQGEQPPRPGTIIVYRKDLLVQCADTAVKILELMPEGKKKMDGKAFLNGYHPDMGECFGEILKGAKEIT